MTERVFGQPGHQRRARLRLIPVAMLLVAATLAVVTAASGAFYPPNPSDPDLGAYSITVDENGANDVPGQKDLSLHGIDESNLPNQLKVLWDWDETSISGNNTLDACVLLNSDSDLNANYALCLTLGAQPLVQQSLRLYSCGDARNDRCSSQVTPIALPAGANTSCTFAVTANTDPFPGPPAKATGADYSNDARAKCTVDLDELSQDLGDLELLNTCSYPSQEPNSDPSDCVLIPRDATLVIVKDAGDSSQTFPFTVSGGGTFSGNVSDAGSPGSQTVGIVSGVNTTVTEGSLPTGWGFVSRSCSGSTATNGNNIGGSGQNIIVKANAGNTITCTFVNQQLSAPVVTIVKSCPNGAHASTDRFQAKDGSTNAGSELPCSTPSAQTTYSPGVGVAYSITEAAGNTSPATNLSNYDITYSATGCSGTLNYGGTATCTITNTLKAAPQLKIEKSCPDGAQETTDRFQPQNNLSSAGLNQLACGGNQTITLVPDTAYAITEIAGSSSPATNLNNYTTAYSAGCTDTDGVPRGTALTTCTITNTLKKYTVITIVCRGSALHSSSVTLDSSTLSSLAAAPNPPDAATLCALTGARFTGKKAGTYTGSVQISP